MEALLPYGIFSLTSASTLLSFLVFIIYFRNNFTRGLVFKGISFLLFLLSLRFFTIHLYLNDLVFEYPHFLLVNNLTSRIGLPLLYFVILSSLYTWELKWFDFLHLILPSLFIVHFSEIFLTSSSVKISIIQEMEIHGYDIVWQKGLFKSPYLINGLKYLTIYGYTFLIFTLLLWSSNYKKLPNNLIGFIKLVVVFLVLNLIPSLLSHFGPDVWGISSLVGASSTLLLALGIFLLPDFLFPAVRGNLGLVAENHLSLQIEELSPNSENQLFEKIDLYLQNEKPFLNPDFSLHHLEKQFGISGRYISEAIKAKTSLNFSTYINQMRLDFLEDKLSQNVEIGRLTVDEIAYELGFRNGVSLYQFLKKSKGCTPSEYFNSLLKS